jgi:uncharacterized glyoxalase superfamily protein PhnB
MQTITPMLSYEDAATAIEWLERAFGFREDRGARQTAPDGTVTHAEIRLGDGVVMLATPTPDYRGPKRHAEECEPARRWLAAPWVIDGVLVHVDDVDAHFARARDAGATLLSEVEENPFGRLYRVADLEGHRWMFLQPAG